MNMATRPESLKEVAERSDSLREFGLNLRDWLHELRRISSRPQATAAVSEELREVSAMRVPEECTARFGGFWTPLVRWQKDVFERKSDQRASDNDGTAPWRV